MSMLLADPLSVTSTAPPGSNLLLLLLGWLLWAGFWASVAGIIIAGAMMALSATSQHGSGGKHGLALGLALAGAIICGSATQLVSGVS